MLLALISGFVALLLLGCPIHISMGVVAGSWFITSSVPDFVVAQKIYGQTDNFSLMAIPFFMLAGRMMEVTGITESIMKFASSLVGHIRGGLAHTATVTGIIMAGVSGSANADGAAIGSVMLQPLKKNGFKDGEAVAIIAAAGALGPIIPPSIFMIIYANATSFNVGQLFMAGVIPGALMGLGFMIINYIYARRNDIPVTNFQGFRYIWDSFKVAFWALVMPIIILGGIMGGMFTATEAGVIASIYGIIYGICRRKINIQVFRKSLTEAVMSSIGPMLLISVSGLFAFMLTSLGTDKVVADFVLTYLPNQYLFMLFILVLGLILGCFIDSIASCLMLMPILTPIVKALGIDFLHFSIVFAMSFLTCTITPPVGTLLYVVCGVDGTPVMKAVKPITPYVLVMAFVILLVIFVPQIGTWLPSLI